MGLAVADRHVALVASAFPRFAAPVTGSTQEGGLVSSSLIHRGQGSPVNLKRVQHVGTA